MAKRLTEEQYDKLREAFLREPDNVTYASEFAGVNWDTAKRALIKGAPGLNLPPIQAVLNEARIKARSLIEADRAAERARSQKEQTEAKENAIQTRKQEGQITQFARASSVQALAVVIELSRSARSFADVLKERVAVEREKVELWNRHERAVMAQPPGSPPMLPPEFARPALTLDALLAILNRSADYAQKITACARQAMEMERLYLGEPTNIIGTIEERRDVSLEELAIRRDAALQAIDSSLREGGLRVIEGGQAPVQTIGRRVIPPPIIGKGS